MRTFQQSYYIGGTWAANHGIRFKAHAPLTLTHVSVNNSTANAGKIDVGTSSDDDAYLDNQDFGVSGTPVEYGRSSFVGGEYPHIAKGTVVVMTLTDHVSHMANATVVITFVEG